MTATDRSVWGRTVSTAGMHYDDRRRTLTVEASELGPAGQALPAVIRVRSHRTGAEMPFTYSHRETTGRGEDVEVAAWVFRSPTGLTLKIFND